MAKHTNIRIVSNDPGRRQIAYACPMCGHPCEAFHWSMAGAGKRCLDCGAVAHLANGGAVVNETKTK